MTRCGKLAVDAKFRLKFVLTVASLFWATCATADIWRIALIGDTPYSEAERVELPKMLSAIADSPVDLIAHIGDFKLGSTRCDDAVFDDRRALFDASQVPFLFVPGDNEWTDCDRLSNGAYDPMERLARLRKLFWPAPLTLGQSPLPLQRQAGPYPEHSRLRLGPVLVVSLNIPGGNNNWGLLPTPKAEHLQRNPWVLNWIKESFTLARRKKLAGIVFLFQANPGFDHHAKGLPHAGFRELLDRLRDEARTYAGKVLLVHGDTHIARIDHPLRDKSGTVLGNVTRVETFGYPFMGWTRAVIDTTTPELWRFEMHRWPPEKPANTLP